MASWQDYLKSMRSQVGGTGLTALKEAQRRGASTWQINRFLANQGWSIGGRAQQAGFKPAPQKRSTRTQPSSRNPRAPRQESWQDYLKSMRSQVGGTGLTALREAERRGASKSQINSFIAQQGWSIGSGAQQAGFRPAAPPPSARTNQPASAAPQSSSWQNYLKSMRSQVGGTGLTALREAERRGASKDEINRFIAGQGWTVGSGAQAEGYGPQTTKPPYAASTGYGVEQYKSQLESLSQQYENRFAELTRQYTQAASRNNELEVSLSAAQKEVESEKQRAADLEKQKNDEREIAVAQQLSSLKSGSAATGGAGSGLGSLSSGRSSYSVATGGKSGGILDRAYKDIDPTDSVLDSKVSIALARGLTSGGAARAESLQRVAARRSSASAYYAQRFG